MKARDILTATHKLEGSGMARSQSEAIAETIVAAVTPLVTKKDLAAVREETKADIAALKEQMATKTDIANIKTDIANINTNIESAKFRLSVLFGGLIGSILVAGAGNMYF